MYGKDPGRTVSDPLELCDDLKRLREGKTIPGLSPKSQEKIPGKTKIKDDVKEEETGKDKSILPWVLVAFLFILPGLIIVALFMLFFFKGEKVDSEKVDVPASHIVTPDPDPGMKADAEKTGKGKGTGKDKLAEICKGMVLYYDFNNIDGKTVKDMSGIGNDGVAYGVEQVAGLKGKAVKFTSSEQYITNALVPKELPEEK